jgi:DNA-binding CsgD family transcriptional regulator
MVELTEADYRNLLNAIEILQRDLDYDSFPERVVDAVAAVVDVDLISYNEVNPVNGTSRFLLRPDVARMAPDSAEYAALVRRFGNHPIVAQHVSRTADSALASFVNRLRLLGMVGNCCGEAELRLNVGLTVASSGSQLVGIAINRSVRDFDDRDGARMEMLRPHIVSAYRHARRLADSANRLPAAAQLTAAALTHRESQVLYWVAMGKTNQEVGTILGARPLTIKKHLEHIYDKLGVPNRTAAARMSRGLATL